MTRPFASSISEGLPPDMPGAWQLHPDEVAGVAAYVRIPGSVAAGDVAWRSSARRPHLRSSKGCAGCHMIAGQGDGIRSRTHGHRRAAQRGISAADAF